MKEPLARAPAGVGEGFASVRGCGVLADLDGNDVYDAGGVHVHAVGVTG